jgi:hypothetical protein
MELDHYCYYILIINPACYPALLAWCHYASQLYVTEDCHNFLIKIKFISSIYYILGLQGSYLTQSSYRALYT